MSSSGYTKSYFLVFAFIISQFFILLLTQGGQAQEELMGWSEPIDISDGVTENWRAHGVPVCDPYQHLHIFWTDNSDETGAIYHREEVDGIWSPPNDIVATQTPRMVYLQASISDQSEQAHLLWVNSFVNGELYHTKAPINNVDDARAWAEPDVLDSGVFNGSIMIDALGVVHVVYSASDDGSLSYDVLYIRSIDDGLTWTYPESIYSTSAEGPFTLRVEAALDEKLRIHIGLTKRSQRYSSFSEIGYIKSDPGISSWSDYSLISAEGSAWQGIDWIAPFTFGEDEVHLTWHDPRRMHQWSIDGGDSWSEPDEIIPLGAAFGGANQLVKISNGTIYAILASLNEVLVVKWNGEVWGGVEEIESRPMDLHYQRIVLCQGNQLHVTYYDTLGDATVWYSMRELDSPGIPQQSYPLPMASMTPEYEIVNHTPTSSPSLLSPTVTPSTKPLINPSSNKSPSSAVSLVFLGLVPSSIFIALILTIKYIQKNH